VGAAGRRHHAGRLLPAERVLRPPPAVKTGADKALENAQGNPRPHVMSIPDGTCGYGRDRAGVRREGPKSRSATAPVSFRPALFPDKRRDRGISPEVVRAARFQELESAKCRICITRSPRQSGFLSSYSSFGMTLLLLTAPARLKGDPRVAAAFSAGDRRAVISHLVHESSVDRSSMDAPPRPMAGNALGGHQHRGSCFHPSKAAW
jgi:hypothetical protein